MARGNAIHGCLLFVQMWACTYTQLVSYKVPERSQYKFGLCGAWPRSMVAQPLQSRYFLDFSAAALQLTGSRFTYRHPQLLLFDEGA